MPLPNADTMAIAGPPDQWQALIVTWLANQRSRNTVRMYKQAWRIFLAFCGKHPAGVEQADVMAWRDEMKERGLAAATITFRLSAISSLYLVAIEKGLCQVNPVEGVRRPIVGQYSNATWMEDNADHALLNAIDTTTEAGLRDKAIAMLMLTRGLRVESVATLQIDDITQDNGWLRIRHIQKGRDDRTVKVPPRASKIIMDYLIARGRPGSGPLFVSTQSDRAISVRSIQARIGYWCDKAFGPGHGLHPHSLRHTAAQNALEAGVPLTEVSNLLGHTNTRTTLTYAHATRASGNKAAGVLDARYQEDDE